MLKDASSRGKNKARAKRGRAVRRRKLTEEEVIVTKLAEAKEIAKSITKLFQRDMQESKQAAASLSKSKKELIAKYLDY